MADKKKPGLLDKARKGMAAQADALKASATAALREKAAGIREAIGPEKLEPVKQPERPFGRDDGGQDVKQVVWTGHTVKTREGQAYFGAVGLTQAGYYRAAEVQVYGSDEAWRWQGELHSAKDDALKSAETMSANRLNPQSSPAKTAREESWNTGSESGKLEANKMAIPDNVKAQADLEVQQTGAGKSPVKDLGETPGVNWDDTKGLEAQRERQRQDAIDAKRPEPGKEPDKS